MTATNYVSDDGENTTAATTTLVVLEGAVAVRQSWDAAAAVVRLVSGESLDVLGEHAVTTVSATPSCYVYAKPPPPTPPPPSPSTPTAEDRRPGCSDACYAFALDAVKTALSALFAA